VTARQRQKVTYKEAHMGRTGGGWSRAIWHRPY
jgi:hypothetical protein